MGTPRAGSPATPVTGDRYLDLLVRFVERNAGALLDGTVTLRLHPVGLHYVASRLEALRELEAVGAGAPVDYLRAYVADLGDHRALEQLRRILRLLTSLKVVTPGPGRDPAPLSLLPFARLRVLELRGCDLSTSAARGLLDLRHTLERLVCFNSTDALRHVFASRIMDIKDSPVWSKLSYVSCASNGVVLMDESLQLLPAIEILDLSRNKFAKVDNLQKCTKLRTLDLGFNHLRSISSLSEVSSRIVKLVVRNNALTTVNGIENLKSLMGLDLSYNIISNFSELEMLGTLSLLQNLWLEGNPICCARWYRAHVFSFFRNPENLKLDDKGMNTQEYWEKQVLFACRQNQPAGYGFYFPAIDDHEDEDEDLLNMKMRRISRLASIVEEERNLCDEGVEQQSTHCDSDSSKKDETAAVDHDIRIASLINTAELLKKQKSSNWLREFKEWMDDNTEKTEGDNLSVDLTNGNGKYIRQKKKQKAHKETSNSMSDLVQVSEGGSSSNLLESDSSFTDNGFSGSNGVIKQSSNELNFDQDHLNFNSFQRPAPLELVATSQTDPFSELENGSRNMLANGTPSNTMSKLIESSPPHTYSSPQSPPQYKEDILHRRLFLEEEFLEISGHLHSVGSLGSGSSCSDGSSSDYGSCISEDDCEKIQTKMELPINGQMVLFPSVNGDDHEAKNKLEHFSGENTLSDHSEEGEPSCSDHREFDIKEFHDNNQRNGHLGHYLGHLIGQKGKEKFKWRVFPFKNRNGTKLEIPKMNGDQVVAEHVLVEGNGQLTCNPSKSTHKEGSKSHSSNILHKKNSSIGTNIIPRNTGEHKTLEDFFNMEIANKDGSETCEQVACCAYMVQDSSGLVQREVALLRSSQNKLYVLLLDMVFDGQETMPSILGSYSLESLEKVSIGLGLQALRVHMSDDTTHLFFTRTSKEAQDVLWLLSVTNFPKLNHKIHFQSWENIQVKLFEKCIIPRTANMGIFLYSMLMFWRNDAEEDSLFIRSIFVIEGSILVCIEDLDQFGAIPYDSNPPYFSLDASCSISNIREVVMDQHNNKCLTLIFDNRKQGEIHNSIQNPQDKQSDEINTVHTWKLEWFSEEASLKFISVLKALYSTAAASSLPVKCIS